MKILLTINVCFLISIPCLCRMTFLYFLSGRICWKERVVSGWSVTYYTHRNKQGLWQWFWPRVCQFFSLQVDSIWRQWYLTSTGNWCVPDEFGCQHNYVERKEIRVATLTKNKTWCLRKDLWHGDTNPSF